MAKTTKKTTTKAAAPTASTAKKTASKKAPVKKAVAKKVATKKKAVAKKAPATRAPAPTRRITAADRRQMIAEAAYLRGESMGFLSDEREDWLLAEAEVDALLAKAKVRVSD